MKEKGVEIEMKKFHEVRCVACVMAISMIINTFTCGMPNVYAAEETKTEKEADFEQISQEKIVSENVTKEESTIYNSTDDMREKEDITQENIEVTEEVKENSSTESDELEEFIKDECTENKVKEAEQQEQIEELFERRKLTKKVSGVNVAVEGMMPADAQLFVQVEEITSAVKESMAKESTLIEDVTVLDREKDNYSLYSYDISILYQDMEYEPCDFDENIAVTFTMDDKEAFSCAELEVFHVMDENSSVEKIEIVEASENEVVIEASHFSTYIILADISYDGEVNWNYDYIGENQTFITPVTGRYALQLYGAQGENSIYHGGNGGYVYTEVYLEKGQELSLIVGGQGDEVYGAAGGNGNIASGGGATYIESEGTVLAIAGGGGAGNRWIAGGMGGAADAGNTDNYLYGGSSEETYTAGGGGGYRGGSYGYAILHKHTGSSSAYGGCYVSPVYHSHSGGCYRQGSWVSPHYHNNSYTGGHDDCALCSVCGGHEAYGHSLCSELVCTRGNSVEYYNLGCGKTEGVTVDTAAQAKGGSSYVNDTYCKNTNMEAGRNPENGMIQISLSEVDVETVDMNITLNQDGVTEEGTKSIAARYGMPLPEIVIPKKNGWIFEGYYTEKEGNGKKYYHADGSNIAKSDFIKHTTLYANWVDPLKITKQPIDVTVKTGYNAVTMRTAASVSEDFPCSLSYQWYIEEKDGICKKIEGAITERLDIPTGFSVGEYQIFCEITATSEENKQSLTKRTDKAAFIVDKGILLATDIVITENYFIYDGNFHEVNVSLKGMKSDDKIYYSLEELTKDNYLEKGTETPLSYRDAGIYSVYVYIVSKNYEDYKTRIELQIEKAEQTVIVQDKKVQYHGAPQKIDDAKVYGVGGSILEEAVVSYIYYVDAACTKKTSTKQGALMEGTEPAKVGIYYVLASAEESENYVAAVTKKPAKLEIYEIPKQNGSHGDNSNNDNSNSDNSEDSGGNQPINKPDEEKHVHTYELITFVPPTKTADGWALYRCHACGNEITYYYDKLKNGVDMKEEEQKNRIDQNSFRPKESNKINTQKLDEESSKFITIEEEPISLITMEEKEVIPTPLEESDLLAQPEEKDDNTDEKQDSFSRFQLICMFLCLAVIMFLCGLLAALCYPLIVYKRKHRYHIEGQLAGEARGLIVDVDKELSEKEKMFDRKKGIFLFKGFCEKQECNLLFNNMEGKTVAVLKVHFSKNASTAEILTVKKGYIVNVNPLKHGISIEIQ